MEKKSSSVKRNSNRSSSTRNSSSKRVDWEKKRLALKKKKVKENLTIGLIVATVLYLLVSLNLVLQVIWMEIIPTKYLVPLVLFYVFTFAVLALGCVFNNLKNSFKITLITLASIGIIVFGVGTSYFSEVKSLFNSIKSLDYLDDTYYLLALEESSYESLSDLSGLSVGIYDNNLENYSKVVEEIQSTISVNIVEEDILDLLIEDLIANVVEAIVINSVYLENLYEEQPDYNGMFKIIEVYDYEIIQEDITKSVEVKSDSFNVYISGIDTYGSISNVARTDVNMVVTINPITNEILLTSIPRDYYVNIIGKNSKDKLTHTGIYGIDTSVKSVENLLDIDINYYVKVNFSTLIGLIDSIGGVTIYNDIAFNSSMDGTYFPAGNIALTGESALVFSRERYAFSSGDIQRGINQQKVISAIISKVSSSTTIISNYSNIMKTLSNSFETNMSQSEIVDLVNLQLDKMPSWDVTSYSLTGSGSSAYTYSYPNQLLYVMNPDATSLANAKSSINNIYYNTK